jgi:ferrous iron transport protein A
LRSDTHKWALTFGIAKATTATIANELHLPRESGSAQAMTLDHVPVGQRARIVAVAWDSLVDEEARRLRALGLDQGARVAVSHRGVFGGGDPIAVEVGRMTVALRRAHARAMTVEAL